MSFGLQNAGATYQGMVNMVFEKHIGRYLEVYVDIIVVKSSKEEKYIVDLDGIFQILQKHNMKLNPFKHSFGVAPNVFRIHNHTEE